MWHVGVTVSFTTTGLATGTMNGMSHPDVDAAEAFLAASARILDRRRFERPFRHGAPAPVRDAVAAYRDDDGGFGHGLEPDGRASATQPAAIAMALGTLHDADAWEQLAADAWEWLARHALAEGGSRFVEPTIAGWPHEAWWQPEDGRPASLVSTGQIAGVLHARLRRPPLDHVTVDPEARGEAHGPLAFAPNPDSVARRTSTRSSTARGQRDDDGWTFTWPARSPAAERDRRGR